MKEKINEKWEKVVEQPSIERKSICRGRLALDKIFHFKHCPLTNVTSILALVEYSDNAICIRLLCVVSSIDMSKIRVN